MHLSAILCCLPASVGVALSAQPALREAPDKLVFGNDRIELTFDRATGAWTGLVDKAVGDNLMGYCPLRTPVDFQVNGALVCSAAAPPPPSDDARDLSGDWTFRTDPGAVGVKEGWAKGLPEAGARRLRVPGYWETQGVTDVFPDSPEPSWTPYNGDAWYQREVDIPAGWAGGDLQLALGSVDDFDWAYVNGELVGHTGEETATWWAARRLYTVAAKLVKFGATNQIVIRVHDRGGDGGIAGHVLLGRAGKLPELGAWSPCGLHRESHAVVGNALRLTCRAGDWRVTAGYELLPDSPVVRRSLHLKYAGSTPARLGQVLHLVPGVRIGEVGDCELRGPQFDDPVRPFGELTPGARREASMAGDGAWSAVYNRKQKRAVVCSFLARTEGFAGWAREGEQEVSLGSTLWVADEAQPGQEYDFGTQYVSVRHGDWFACLTAVRDMYTLDGFVARPNAPEWAQRAILYTMYPGGTMESGLNDTGGFRNVVEYTLPRLKQLGINTLWFLPLTPGLYGPKDYYAIEPRIGTEEDLHTCVAAAKTAGVRTLLDLVPHGPQTSSPIGTEHPDWIAKDEAGQPALWWGCQYCDYANPGWQQYMADLARDFVAEHGVKGWRVDCAAGGPANWDPARKVRASMSGLYGGLEVLKAAKQSMRQVDPETVLLPEALGPMMLENSELVYDYPLYFGVLKKFASDASPEAWCAKTSLWLEQQRLSWPPSACFGLMRFLENHDNVRFWRQAGVGPARALMTMCAWIQGVPLYHHLQEVGSSEQFEQVNALRTAVDELNVGTARYLAARPDKPGIFTCLREAGDKKALVAINLTAQTVATTISLPADALPKGATLIAYDAWRGAYVNAGGPKGSKRAALAKVTVRLPAYEPALVLLRPTGAPLGLPPEPKPARPMPQAPALPVLVNAAKTPTGAWIAAGGVSLAIDGARGGLPSAVKIGGTNVLHGLDLGEGRAKPFGPGRPFALATAGQAAVTVSDRTQGVPTVTVEGSTLRGNLGGAEVRLPYRLTYRAVGVGDVRVGVAFQAPQTLRRTSGTLTLELAFQDVGRWAIDTVEGRLADRSQRFHPVPGDYRSGWLQHVVGDRLWENATLPLDPRIPYVWVSPTDGAGSLGIGNFQASAALPVDNIYLRETRGADRKELGPTLVVAWMDDRGPRDLDAGTWYELTFDLVLFLPPARLPRPAPAAKAVSLRAEGGNYALENKHYRLVVGKSGGGVIRSFGSKATGWQAITGSDTYTDAGFYEKKNGEGGNFSSAADWPDLDPEVRITRAGRTLTLEVAGKLHGSNWNWAFAASPAIEYRKTFVCDESDTVRCEVAVRPFARQQAKAFLAHRLIVPPMAAWCATGEQKLLSGKPGGPNTRTWQSRAAPLRAKDAVLALTGAGDESLVLSHVNLSPAPQNVFLHQSGDAPNLFFAWYDFDPVDAQREWHVLRYDLRIVPGGESALKRIVGRQQEALPYVRVSAGRRPNESRLAQFATREQRVPRRLP